MLRARLQLHQVLLLSVRDNAMSQSRHEGSGDSKSDVSRQHRLTEADMPGDFSISLAAYTRGGTDKFLETGRDDMPPQALRGFAPEYRNIIDYIVRITHRIWEEKNIGYIYDCYSHNSSVHDDYGLQLGRDKIVADTIHTVNAFPDIRLVADEIIWAGNEDLGFRTSHRVTITGHNTGFSKYGPPTNNRVSFWCVANCVARENEIYQEHVLYNTGSLVKQLGLDLFETARQLAAAGVNRRTSTVRGSEPRRQNGQGKPLVATIPNWGANFNVEEFEQALHQNVWNRRMLGVIPKFYSENLEFFGPTDRKLHGVGAYQSFVLSLLAMFPDLALTVDEVYWMGNTEEGFRVSVRWSATGTHRGHGIYGAPTHRPVSIWGLTEHWLFGGQIREEWMLFNEMDLLMQLLGQEAPF